MGYGSTGGVVFSQLQTTIKAAINNNFLGTNFFITYRKYDGPLMYPPAINSGENNFQPHHCAYDGS